MSDRDVRDLAEEIFRDVTVEDGVEGIEARLRAFLAEQEPTAQVHAERDAATKTLAKMLEREMPPGAAADLIGLHKELEAVKAKRDALPSRHGAHIVTKRRNYGDRDGEITCYLVGPQRATFGEAEDDLSRFEGAGQQAGALAALRGALDSHLVSEDFSGEDFMSRACDCGAITADEFEELVHFEGCPLATTAGRLEAEVIRAVLENAAQQPEGYWIVRLPDEMMAPLLAARGGEG